MRRTDPLCTPAGSVLRAGRGCYRGVSRFPPFLDRTRRRSVLLMEEPMTWREWGIVAAVVAGFAAAVWWVGI
jgi:hypothetical protein